MSRMLYWVCHIILLGIVIGAIIAGNLLQAASEAGSDNEVLWIAFAGGCFLVVLLWWFGVVRTRLQDMGLPPWLCWMYAFIGPFLPIPFVRLLPWVAGFFVPSDTFA